MPRLLVKRRHEFNGFEWCLLGGGGNGVSYVLGCIGITLRRFKNLVVDIPMISACNLK